MLATTLHSLTRWASNRCCGLWCSAILDAVNRSAYPNNGTAIVQVIVTKVVSIDDPVRPSKDVDPPVVLVEHSQVN